ncbi:MAG TPA: hypothetical protein PKE69_06800 [Pyrinomonadaceae bacterium]|nr:hypothetical protein [Pyrinomonadaceae bacterium]
MQEPSILKERNNPESLEHIGGLGNFMQPLCKKFSDDEMDIIGWVSSRGWKPNDKFCRECAELYEKGLAWKFPSGRE